MDIFGSIDRWQQKIDSFRPFDDDLLRLWQERLRIDWTYNSNAIEGNTLTYDETNFFLREGLTSEGKPLHDYLEAQNHAEAIEALYQFIHSQRELSESFIKSLHGVLLKNIDHTVAKGADGSLTKKPLHAGSYKTQPNHVLTISGTVHQYTDPLKVVDEIQELLQWLADNDANNTIEVAAIFHYRFVCIHPFDDGNGRMSRLLMNLILMQAGFPPCIIRNKNRRLYLQKLEQADQGDVRAFVQFVADELLQTQMTMLETLQGKIVTNNSTKKISASARKQMIIELLDDTPHSIGDIHAALQQIKRPTLKKDLQELVKNKQISKIGRGKGTTYSIQR